MAFITQAVTVLQTLVIALGAGLAVWGVVNLMEGYGNDNPGAEVSGHQAAHGWWRRCPYRHYADPVALDTVLISAIPANRKVVKNWAVFLKKSKRR